MAKRATSSKTRQSKKSPTSTSSRGRTVKSATKKRTTTKSSSSGTAASDQEVTLDRRRRQRREESDRAQPTSTAERPKLERRKKVNRRRQIDPTTCERDYSQDEIEFMSALDEYKRANGRMFPTCSEVLEVIRGLGYVKLAAGEMAPSRSHEPLPAMVNDVDEEEEFGEEMAAMAMAGDEAY